jgi:serine/threonine protein kinase
MPANLRDPNGVYATPDTEALASSQATTGGLSESAIDRAGAALATDRFEPIQLGRYRLLRELGRGGMGIVYLAEDAEGTRVAVKALSREAVPDEQAIRRLQKEARLLAEIRHPHVANLLETGEANGICYLAMEYVHGTDLRWLLSRHRQLPERLVLQIVRDVAEALAAAHDRGIVHRDIKPGNILLSAAAVGSESPAEAVAALVAGGSKPLARLTDFGLARHIQQSASQDLTRTGALLGTPYYIAPEQCVEGREVSPATDVYSLGATCFEMLAGRPPFVAGDSVKLIAMHCFDEAPDLRKLNPAVSDGTARLVARALAKNAGERFADARHLLTEIDRLLRGETSDVELHPRVPQAQGKLLEAVWEWDLESPPELLWPLASNTERINCAVGVPAVEYTTERDEYGAVRKLGTFRMGWAVLAWVEHPFEWVEGRRLGVLREFRQGPFHWFLSIVELLPQPAGGTRLKHTVRIAPRGLLGRLLAFIEVKLKGRRALDRIYPRIDRVASGRLRGSPALDPFEPPAVLKKSVRERFEVRAERMQHAGADPECAERLVQFLQESPAQELARIRPIALARRLGVDADRLTEACLYACEAGLLELHWDILCPTCRTSSTVKDTLAEIDRHAHCEACDLDFDVDFGNAVELIFRIHPELRQANLKTYCIGGPEHAPHVVAQVRLAAGEALELDLALDAGSYVLRGPQLPYAVRLAVDAGEGTGRATLSLGREFDSTRIQALHAGRQLLALENRYARPLLVRLERIIVRTDVLTAARAGGIPVFARLFPGEVVSRERLADFSSRTLVAIRLTEVSRLCSTLGDAGAWLIVRERLGRLEQAVAAHGGQVVKKLDEQLLAAFPQTLSAVRLAVDVVRESETRPAGGNDVPVRAALHRGAALATTAHGRVDYFGSAVIAATGLLDAAPDSLVLSEELSHDREVLALLEEQGLHATLAVTGAATIADGRGVRR